MRLICNLPGYGRVLVGNGFLAWMKVSRRAIRGCAACVWIVGLLYPMYPTCSWFDGQAVSVSKLRTFALLICLVKMFDCSSVWVKYHHGVNIALLGQFSCSHTDHQVVTAASLKSIGSVYCNPYREIRRGICLLPQSSETNIQIPSSGPLRNHTTVVQTRPR